ncbi:MAG: sensor histidine kinase [Spirochaetaceae bacterium]|nr:MAG: sensor histidine kinase [Spirochaetaceae bacterium]
MERSDAETARWGVKIAVWLYAAGSLAASQGPDVAILALLLLCIAVDIADARFFRSVASVMAKSVIIVAVAWSHPALGMLVASTTFDLAMLGSIPAVAIPVAVIPAVLPPEPELHFAFASILAAAAGWIARRHADSSAHLIVATDAERGSRYRLEEAQRRLDTASADLVRATEHAERTRIARAIHDDVGHRLNGVLMQLQAVRRLVDVRPDRAASMLDTAIVALGDAVESVRETVHDLRPRPPSDAAALRRLASEFRFCPVNLSVDDHRYGALPANHREACVAAVRELLTNAARYSRARSISITIDCGSRMRLVYRDDGVGSARIREGLGLSGIRRRIEALGGTIAVSGHDGFVVRCVVPLEGPLEGGDG